VEENLMRDIVIVGAGPAGLFAAINCTTMGRNVTVIEKTNTPGKKLLISGGGQCNLTNAEPTRAMLDRYFGSGRFLKPALMTFDSSKLMNFFEERGLKLFVREDGKVFPSTYSARDVLEVLLAECEKQGIRILYNCRVKGIARRTPGGFVVSSQKESWVPTIWCLLPEAEATRAQLIGGWILYRLGARS
jgi:predicted Rossmann fold flavoprotein